MQILKNLFLTGLLCALCQMTYAQLSFSHAVGGSLYMSSEASAPGIMYSPRLNVLELNDELTLSVGTHLGLGLSLNSRSGANSLALDIPLVAELNFGHAAQPDTKANFGGFVGLGYGISRIGSAGSFSNDYNEANGILFNGGLRFYLSDLPVGVRGSYMLNTKKGEEDGYVDVYSLGIFLTLR